MCEPRARRDLTLVSSVQAKPDCPRVQRITRSGGNQDTCLGLEGVGVFLCSQQRQGKESLHLCVTLSLSSRMKMKISFCCHVRQEVCALGSHYHQMYFVSISFTSHLFSLRTHCLDCAANRPFALLSLKHYIPIRKKKKKKS